MFRALLISLLIIVPSGPTLADNTNRLDAHVIAEFGEPPTIPTGPLSYAARAAVKDLLDIATNQSSWAPTDSTAFKGLAASGDPRLGWLLADAKRFAWRPEVNSALDTLASALLMKTVKGPGARRDLLDTLLAWDVPGYPGYLADKRRLYTRYVDGWEDLFVEGNLEWHRVDWGGVNIDARPFGETDAVCDCIPAADNPTVTDAQHATWLKDDAVVFGVVINGEARAYPRQIMEIREMVNDTLGGRDIAIPYCSLCGAAQAYFTDRMPQGLPRPIMRTSGLLIRSNKIMYDLETSSLFDTFRGRAVTGLLSEIGLILEPVTVITSDWAAWRAAYPETTVLTEDLALGRDYNLTETRDANGPIFAVGDVDARLDVQELVLGGFTETGAPVAFPSAKTRASLASGDPVRFEGLEVIETAGGLTILGSDGTPVASFEAYWFAWSQFHEDTALWEGKPTRLDQR